MHFVYLKTLLLILATNSNSESLMNHDYRYGRFLWYPTRPIKSGLYNDLPPSRQETFDFIIVGSGSSGATLANRLSENTLWKVLLLEVGDVATALNDIPAMAPLFQKTKFDWGYVAEKENGSCWGCPEQRMLWPRGRGLGGSTLINFMIHVRGNPEDYNKWEAMGNPGWGYKDVLPYFMKLEDSSVEVQDGPYRHQGGYMPVTDVPYRTEAAEAFVEAAQEAGYPYVDYNGKSQMGVSFVQANLRNGLRCSIEKAYLRPIRNRKNLKILTNSRVIKILIDSNTKAATGVEFLSNRKYYKISAQKEVILSAGAFNSPQLLMLSGIGPKDHLEELGIEVIKDLPVGKKLYDHITFLGLNYLVNQPIIATSKVYYNASNVFDLFNKGKGPLTLLGGVEALMYMKSNFSTSKRKYPDMEVIFLGSNVAADKGVAFKDTVSISSDLYNSYWREIEDVPFFQVLLMLVHPKSVGYLKLKSKNPFHWPKFYPQYFTDENNEDIKTFVASIREINRVIKMPALRKFKAELYDKPMPGCEKYPFDSDAYWECCLRTITPTLHHQVGTCKMGPSTDKEAVVDHRLKVHGIRNLRVVDTSIIPMALTAHTNIPAIMVGEKAADLIKEDWMNNEVD
ncbi:glucose dehydrogenase [FAD, quinone]-like isoform X1 [Euwallacea fornicatus]|uniref:glucose dehydrogenase [FAD, quinone]-like isoform X1 n=2 Tax=Euwallacea fornicatus TaxID=995702 RepID=UPI00338FA778